MSEELNLADANLHALHAERAALRLADQVCLDLWAYLSIPARAYAPLGRDK